MNKILKYKTALLTLVFSLFFVLIPDQAHGFVFDLAQTQLAALSERTGPFAAFFIYTFLFFIIGYLALLIATSLLQGIITITPTALTVTGGDAAEFVRAGWNLSAGIVNLLLIIAFIVIAFAVILGSEKIQFKKALPMLIVVALLVNFTLLFVGIGIDVSNFLFNTVATQFMVADGENGNIFFNALKPLFDFSLEQAGAVMYYIGISTVALLVPYANVLVQVGWAVGALLSLSSVLQFIFYGAIMWSLSAIFLVYFVVFLARIFIIQILAIFAPLAFFCLIFDNTKKWWSKWLNALVEWLFVGVIFIFLMYIALALAPMVWSLAAPFQDMFPDMLNWFTGDIVSYLVLLIYFVVVIGIAKSFVPAAANAIISQASGVAKAATPWAGALKKGGARYYRNKVKRSEERMKQEPPKNTRFDRIARRGSKFQSWAVRGAHNLGGTDLDREIEKNEEEKVSNLEKQWGTSYEAFAKWQSMPGIKTDTDKAAELKFLSKGGEKALKLMPKKKLNEYIGTASKRGDSKTVTGVITHMPNLADTNSEEAQNDPEIMKTAEAINKVMKEDIDKAIEKMRSKGIKLKNSAGEVVDIGQLNEQEPARAKMAAINDIAAQKLKTEDVKNLSDKTLENTDFIEAIIRNKTLSLIQAMGEEKGGETIKRIDDVMKEMGTEEMKRINPTLLNQIKKTPGGQAMFSGFYEEI